MLCRLCLKSSSDIIEIFESVGLELDVANVLKQHFWFEPKTDDISTNVCNPCWLTVSSFHDFYIGVKEAHRLLAERFSLENNDEKPDISVYPPLELITLELHGSLNTEESNAGATTKNEFHTESDEEEYVLTGNFSDDGSDKINESENDSFKNVQLRRSCRVKAATKSPTKDTRKRRSKEEKTPKATKDTKENVGTIVKRSRGRPRKDKSAVNKPAIDKSATESNDEKPRRTTEDLDEKILKYMKIICDICAMEFDNFTKMKRHMSTEHKCRGYAVCCSRKFYKRVLLCDHIEKHINPKVWRCEECDKVFADKQCLRNHELIKHQPDTVKIFVCNQCPKKFAKAYLLQQHRALHDDRTHTCNLCSKTFATLNSLKIHIKVIHENYGTMCDICAKVIRGKALFARHQLQHSGVELPKVQCDKCGSWHKDKYSLQKHKRRHNEEGIPHTCNICGKVAPNRSAMLSHQRYVHAAQRIFECGVCPKRFKKPIALREHMTVHTGEVLYNCPHCSKTFNSNANMHSHRKKAHPKEFEEARRNRRENINGTKPATSKDDSQTSNDPQVITIRTDDENGETHNILVTTGDFNDDDAEDSIIFTVQ